MFRSFRSRILGVMIGLIVITSGTLMYVAHQKIRNAMMISGQEQAWNVLQLAVLNIKSQYNNLTHYKRSMLETYKRHLKDLTSLQEIYIREYYQKFQQGELSESEAKRAVLEELRQFTYGDNDYFWISDYDSTLISHPDPELHGADFSGVKDVKGNLIVPQMVKEARLKGSCYYSYWWRRLGTEEPVEKLSYAKHFSEWQWVFGTGFYIDDIETAAQQWLDTMIKDLEQSFAEITIANTGYLFAFDEQKQMLIHPTLKGDDAMQLRNPVTKNILMDELIEASHTPDVPFEYLWDRPQNPGEYRFKKQSYVYYFEPLGWYIASSVYNDEFLFPARALFQKVLSLFAIFLLVSIVISILLANTLATPIKHMLEQVKVLSGFDLTVEFDENAAGTEFDQLANYLNQMLQAFKQVLGQVQRSGIQVSSSSTELSATAREQEATMSFQVKSTKNVVNSVHKISDVADHLVVTMQHVASMLQNATTYANTGQEDLLHMEEAMRHMEDASKSISGRLEAISEKADKITTVVTTINKVAEQTNLLSLNASIEAEKAGEYGRGFTVVAREIRRLADQTAVATLDIDRMVQEMQSAVSSGIMEMDKFIAEVRHSAEDVGKISMQLSLIIDQVQALAPNFDMVNESVEQQSDNAQRINAAIMSLSEEMQQTRDSLHETYSAIEQLNEAARGLQEEVSRFKVE